MPPNEKNRLTIDVLPFPLLDGRTWYSAAVLLDGTTLESFEDDSEQGARAAADAWVAELLEHFRKGGT